MIEVRTATQRLIHYPGLKEKFQWVQFDLKQDPDEMYNLDQAPIAAECASNLKPSCAASSRDLSLPFFRKGSANQRNREHTCTSR